MTVQFEMGFRFLALLEIFRCKVSLWTTLRALKLP